jgi:hypothetical protein
MPVYNPHRAPGPKRDPDYNGLSPEAMAAYREYLKDEARPVIFDFLRRLREPVLALAILVPSGLAAYHYAPSLFGGKDEKPAAAENAAEQKSDEGKSPLDAPHDAPADLRRPYPRTGAGDLALNS